MKNKNPNPPLKNPSKRNAGLLYFAAVFALILASSGVAYCSAAIIRSDYAPVNASQPGDFLWGDLKRSINSLSR
jgi:hypothetical protein